MSRRAMILESNDVPNYVKEIAKRSRLLNGRELYDCVERLHKSWEVNPPIDHAPEITTDDYAPGYVFKIYGRRKLGAIVGSSKDIEKLIKWANSWGATAKVLEEHTDYAWHRSTRYEGYRKGERNYWIVLITDPVCLRFERDNFYREEK